MKRPAHATIVAYLALFVAIATGSAWAATQIKSSKQIKKGAVQSSDVKDENLTGKDLRADSVSASEIGSGAVGGDEIADGAVGSGDVADDSLGTADVAQGSLQGGDLAGNTLGKIQISEDSLGLADAVTQTVQTSQLIDNGGGFSVPRSPQGDLLEIDVPAGRHLVIAHVNIGADNDGAGVICSLDAATANPIDTATSVSAVDYGTAIDHTPDSVSASVVTDSNLPFTATFSCADADGGARAFDRTISAISLTG